MAGVLYSDGQEGATANGTRIRIAPCGIWSILCKLFRICLSTNNGKFRKIFTFQRVCDKNIFTMNVLAKNADKYETIKLTGERALFTKNIPLLLGIWIFFSYIFLQCEIRKTLFH
jgi:hypothetical protein